MFFLILVTLMPFALGPDLRLLAKLGPAILWIAALLSTLLGLDRLFQADAEDGSLDARQRRAAAGDSSCWSNAPRIGRPRSLPLIVVAPLFGLMLAMDAQALGARRR